MNAPGPLDDVAGALATLRKDGAADIDPAALIRLEATVRRGRSHDVAVQGWLAARMAVALAELQARLTDHAATPGPTPTADRMSSGPSALRALAGMPAGELQAVQRLRPTLARLRVQRQIARAQARQPDNPGPLNSEFLLVRALQQMQTLAPAYLGPFITQAETLLWLDTARGAGGPGGSAAPGAGRTAQRRVRTSG